MEGKQGRISPAILSALAVIGLISDIDAQRLDHRQPAAASRSSGEAGVPASLKLPADPRARDAAAAASAVRQRMAEDMAQSVLEFICEATLERVAELVKFPRDDDRRRETEPRQIRPTRITLGVAVRVGGCGSGRRRRPG